MPHWKTYASVAALSAGGAFGLLGSAGPAEAVCFLSQPSGALVECNSPFDFDLNFNTSIPQLELTDNTGSVFPSTLFTNLQTDDTITTDGLGSGDILNLLEDGSPGLNLRNGDDTVNVNTGTITGLILGGLGNDTFISSAIIADGLAGGPGDDVVSIVGGSVSVFDPSTATTIGTGPGADVVTVGAGATVNGLILTGADDDVIEILGTVDEAGAVQAIGSARGDDVITIRSGATVLGTVGGFYGEDVITVENTASVENFSEFPTINAGFDDDIIVVGGRVVTSATNIAIAGSFTQTPSEDFGGNDSITILGSAEVIGRIIGGDGNDTITSSGDIEGDIEGGIGQDVVAVSAGSVTGVIFGGGGNDTISAAGTLAGSISGQDGDDVIEVAGDLVTASPASDAVNGGNGNDDVTVLSGATISGRIAGGPGNDAIEIFGSVDGMNSPVANQAISGGDGDDSVTVFDGGAVNGRVSLAEGNDEITVENGATVTNDMAATGGALEGGLGADTITVDGTVTGLNANPAISGGNLGSDDPTSDDDTIVISNTGIVNGLVRGGDGNDTISSTGSVTGNLSGDDGADTITSTGLLVGDILGGNGNDDISAGGTVAGSVVGGSGEDVIESMGSVTGNVEGGAGEDTISVTAGTVDGVVSGGAGKDVIESMGSVTGNVEGGAGDDTISVTAGTVDGVVSGGAGDDNITQLAGLVQDFDGGEGIDTIAIGGGSVGGTVVNFEDILIDAQLSPEVFIQDDVEQPLQIVGNNARLVVRNTRDGINNRPFLATPSGIDQAIFENASVEFFSGSIGINSLTLREGSFLGFRGTSVLSGPGGRGDLTVSNSTISFLDGAADDTLAVNRLALNNGRIEIDVDPAAGRSDAITITDRGPASFTVTGNNNVIGVSFTEPVSPGGGVVIPVAAFDGEGAPTGDDIPANVSVVGIGGNADPLADFRLVTGPDGGLFLATEMAEEIPVENSQVTAATADTVRDTVGDVTNDLADAAIGFRLQAARVQITPTFGIFSSGQFGHVEHDGFDVTSALGTSRTPEFETNSFSAIGVAELDASAEFGLEDIGLRISGFGGYVMSDVDFSRELFDGNLAPFQGGGTNEGGVVGSSVLISRIAGLGNLDYGLVSAAGFFGASDITNADTGGTGDYDTRGVVVAVKGGRNIAVSDDVRLDVRVTGSFNHFEGDPFTDTTGVNFGRSSTTFGTIGFEPGVSTAFLYNDLVISPAARFTLTQRVGYSNEASVNGTAFDFDDGDFSIGAELGANVRITDNLSAGGFIIGRAFEDQTSILGRLGLKYQIPRS